MITVLLLKTGIIFYLRARPNLKEVPKNPVTFERRGKVKSRLFAQYFNVVTSSTTDAHDLGVKAVIEGKIPLMTLHLARSDGSKGSREKCDDQVVFPIVVIQITDQPVMGGGEGKVESFLAHQRISPSPLNWRREEEIK